MSLADELGECEAIFESGVGEVGSSVAGTTPGNLGLRHQEQEFFGDGVNYSLSDRDTIVTGSM